MKDRNSRQGSAAEALVALLFLQLGYDVLTPAYGSLRYDMAVRLRNGRTLYVQVKSSTRFEKDRNHQRVRLFSPRATQYGDECFDYFVAVLQTEETQDVEVLMIPNTGHIRHAVFTPSNALVYSVEEVMKREERTRTGRD